MRNMIKRNQTEGNSIRQSGEAHITKQQFCSWQEGTLEEQEEAEFLGHIGTCTFCAGQFGSWMEEGVQREEIIVPKPPKYLKEEILSRTQQMDIQAAVRIKQTSKQVQLMMYSLKVGFAVAASIFLLTITTGIQNMDIQSQQKEKQRTEWMQERKKEEEDSFIDKLSYGSRRITDMLNDFSNGFFIKAD